MGSEHAQLLKYYIRLHFNYQCSKCYQYTIWSRLKLKRNHWASAAGQAASQSGFRSYLHYRWFPPNIFYGFNYKAIYLKRCLFFVYHMAVFLWMQKGTFKPSNYAYPLLYTPWKMLKVSLHAVGDAFKRRSLYQSERHSFEKCVERFGIFICINRLKFLTNSCASKFDVTGVKYDFSLNFM